MFGHKAIDCNRRKMKHVRCYACWNYDACVVLDGNPLIEEHLTYIQSDESTKEINREKRANRAI